MPSTYTLVSTAEVIDAMGQSPALLADAGPAFHSAIVRATVKLEGLLSTSFDKQVVRESFLINSREIGPLNGYYRLRLSCGTVDTTKPFTLGSSTDRKGSFNAFADYHLDHEKGVVYVASETPQTLDRNYFNVEYTCGFEEGDDVPKELQQALLSYVPLLLMTSNAVSTESKSQAIDARKAYTLDQMAEDMVPRYLRRVGGCFKPMFTTRTLIEPATPDPTPGG